jgi:hypothetical protein
MKMWEVTTFMCQEKKGRAYCVGAKETQVTMKLQNGSQVTITACGSNHISDGENISRKVYITKINYINVCIIIYGAYIWKDIGDGLQAPYYRSGVDHCWKIRSRKIGKDVGKFSFVNRTIADWNRLPEGAIGTSLVKTHIFRKRVRKVYQ